MPKQVDWKQLKALEARTDEAATRELVDLLVEGDAMTRLDAARALEGRAIPLAVHDRVAALILGEALCAEQGHASWPLSIAARALLDKAPGDAFALAVPLLQVSTASRAFDRLRAEKIVIALERLLAMWSGLTDEAWFMDPRFRPLCEQLQRDYPAFASLTAPVIAGFRHFDGEDTEPLARTVHLGGEGEGPFPFLVAGFPIETRAQRDEIDAALPTLARGRPSGLAWLEHQYGGYACWQERILGYGVVPPEGAPFVEALGALSAACTGSFGYPMTEPDLLAWSRRLAGILPPEGAERGAEALLVSPPCAPIETLGGREVLGFGYEGAPWHDHLDLALERDITERGPYGDEHERLLVRLGEALGLGRPRVALLWGSSD